MIWHLMTAVALRHLASNDPVRTLVVFDCRRGVIDAGCAALVGTLNNSYVHDILN